jgi:hypothetical protein
MEPEFEEIGRALAAAFLFVPGHDWLLTEFDIAPIEPDAVLSGLRQTFFIALVQPLALTVLPLRHSMCRHRRDLCSCRSPRPLAQGGRPLLAALPLRIQDENAQPTDPHYRVLFMECDMDEILESQDSMLARLGKPTRPRLCRTILPFPDSRGRG